MTQESEVPLDMRVSIDIAATPVDETQQYVTTMEWLDVRLSIYDDLPTVEHEWCAFEQQADCTVFQSFGWLSTWQVHIGSRKGVRPAVVIGRDARGEILFLLPLSVEPRGFARRLVWLGSESNDYNAPLVAPNFSQRLGLSAWTPLWQEILVLVQGHRDLHFDLIHLEKMPEMVGAQQNPFQRLLPVTTHPSGAYLTHLAGNWETFYATKRSSSTRQRDRTKLNRLREIGEVRFVTPKAEDEISASLDTLMAQKARSFAAMGVGNIFARPGYAEFYRSIAVDTATRQIAHLSRLDVGKIPAAINLGLTFHGCYYHVLVSYDDGDISRFGPGAAHLHELMRYAIDNGCKIYDFTVGDEPYKLKWSDTESSLFDHVATVRWRGTLLAPPLVSLIRIKRFIKQTPVLWSTFSKARALFGSLTPKTLEQR